MGSLLTRDLHSDPPPQTRTTQWVLICRFPSISCFCWRLNFCEPIYRNVDSRSVWSVFIEFVHSSQIVIVMLLSCCAREFVKCELRWMIRYADKLKMAFERPSDQKDDINTLSIAKSRFCHRKSLFIRGRMPPIYSRQEGAFLVFDWYCFRVAALITAATTKSTVQILAVADNLIW